MRREERLFRVMRSATYFGRAQRVGFLRLDLECLQKSDQCRLLFTGERQSKLMAPNRPRIHAMASETSRHEIVAKPPRIEPVFQGGDAAIVLKWSPVPHAAKGGHSVIARAAARCESQPAIRADPTGEYVGPQITVEGDFEIPGRQRTNKRRGKVLIPRVLPHLMSGRGRPRRAVGCCQRTGGVEESTS